MIICIHIYIYISNNAGKIEKKMKGRTWLKYLELITWIEMINIQLIQSFLVIYASSIFSFSRAFDTWNNQFIPERKETSVRGSERIKSRNRSRVSPFEHLPPRDESLREPTVFFCATVLYRLVHVGAPATGNEMARRCRADRAFPVVNCEN